MKLILVLLAIIRCLTACLEIMMWLSLAMACFCIGAGIAALVCGKLLETVVCLACACGSVAGGLLCLRVIRSTNQILDDNDL